MCLQKPSTNARGINNKEWFTEEELDIVRRGRNAKEVIRKLKIQMYKRIVKVQV